MGKIVNSTFVSIDGVINHMEAWHFAYIDDETEQIALEQIQPSEALLMGRNTYDAYAWVHPHFAGVGGPGDLLLSPGNNTRLELIGTRILRSGVVMLSYATAASA